MKGGAKASPFFLKADLQNKQGADPKIHPLRRERRLVVKLVVRVAEDNRLRDKIPGDGVWRPVNRHGECTPQQLLIPLAGCC